LVIQSENGNAIVCDDFGTIMQAGPYNDLYVRLSSARAVGEEDLKSELASLKELLDTILSKYSEFDYAGAMFVTMHETALFLPYIVAHLNSLGFAYHHYGASFPRKDSRSRNEHIYYKWCRAGSRDMVPAYATSIEGVAALVLSPDESSVLLAKERGRFGMPGGVIDPGEGALEAMRRELVEEVGVAIDDAFPPLALGGCQKSRERDAAVNENHHVFAVRARSLALVVDPVELDAAHWFPAAALLAAWRAARAAAPRPPSAARAESVELEADGVRDSFSVTMLVCLEAHATGTGLACEVAAFPSTGGAAAYFCGRPAPPPDAAAAGP
jgi:8-oxo-dGTP pyrophosphatase MutT (NUDIX family)